MDSVVRLMNDAVGAVFPGAVLRVSVGGRVVLHEPFGVLGVWGGSPRVTLATCFDLASLTKPMVVATLAMRGHEEGWLRLDEPVAAQLPEFAGRDRDGITLRMLLEHRSGLPDWRPYMDWLLERHPDEEPGSPAAKERIRSWVLGEPLVARPGSATLYSDLNYMLLGFWLQETLGEPLDLLFQMRVGRPFGLEGTRFIPIEGWEARGAQREDRTYAPTERCPFRQRLLRGEVHDENAFALGGVAGHAGLFGTADDVGLWADTLLNCAEHGGIVARETVRAMWYPERRHPDTTWRLGFDTPSPQGSSAGDRVSRSAVGHLGFTGCSVWIDPPRRATVVLLSNRVHPTRHNERLRVFRPLLHSAVWQEIEATVGHASPETTL